MAHKINISTFLILLLSVSAMAQAETNKMPIDSIFFAGYKAVYYSIPAKAGRPEYAWDILNCDSIVLSSVRSSAGVKLYNFCENSSGPRITCNFQDIDNDGYGEIAFEIPSGAKDSRVSTYIYSPDLFFPEDTVFDGINKDFSGMRLQDLDKDGTPELIFKNLFYRCWHYPCSKSPEPF